MKFPKKLVAPVLIIVVAVAFSAGVVVSNVVSPKGAFAQQGDECRIKKSQLRKLYKGIFHRDLDKGALGYAGHKLDFVIKQLEKSEEHEMYGAIYGAMKGLENAIRAPGKLSTSKKKERLQALNEALATAQSWSDNLPEDTEFTEELEEKKVSTENISAIKDILEKVSEHQQERREEIAELIAEFKEEKREQVEERKAELREKIEELKDELEEEAEEEEEEEEAEEDEQDVSDLEEALSELKVTGLEKAKQNVEDAKEYVPEHERLKVGQGLFDLKIEEE